MKFVAVYGYNRTPLELVLEQLSKFFIFLSNSIHMRNNMISPESVDFYINLRENRYSNDFYNQTSDIFRQTVRPELVSLLEAVFSEINSEYGDLTFEDSTSHIGLSYAHVPAKFAWGAITRNGRHKHNDLQLFIALRYDYLRFGFYLPNKDDFQSTFGVVYRNIEANKIEFVSKVNELFLDGVILSARTAPSDSGEPKQLSFNEKYPQIAIEQNQEFSLISAIPVEEIFKIDLVSVISKTFLKLKPIYDMLMKS